MVRHQRPRGLLALVAGEHHQLVRAWLFDDLQRDVRLQHLPLSAGRLDPSESGSR